MKCPRDESVMATSRHEAGFEIDTCPTCDGVWLDKGELDAVKNKVEKQVEIGTLRPPEDFDFSFSKKMQEDFGSISCPRCGVTMNVREYSGWSDVLVDVCPAGCGLWLDRNELQALKVFFEKNKRDGYEEDEENAAMWSSLAYLFGG